MANQLTGLHHLTAITSSSPRIFRFMSGILGLHLIKKTVNQDDVRTYHLYFTDDIGTAERILLSLIFPAFKKHNTATTKSPALVFGFLLMLH